MAPPGPHRRFAALREGGVEAAAARAQVTGGVAVAVSRALGITLPDLDLLSRWGPPAEVDLGAGEATPWLVGVTYESLLDPSSRRAGGAFYTPAPVAGTVVAWALRGLQVARPVVCDPASGCGAFLLAAAEALAARGLPRPRVVGECLVGADVDPVAAAVTEAALALWCGGTAVPRLVVGDALALERAEWPSRPHVVVGNPPFLNQLGRRTARSRPQAAALSERFGAAARGYVDTAVVFLVAATSLVRPRGAVAMVLPRSFLAARGSARARSAVLDDAVLEVLWLPPPGVFGAAVSVCVPVLRRGGARRGTVSVCRDLPAAVVDEVDVDADELQAAPTWAHLAGAATEVPRCEPVAAGTLGRWCEVHADFRQQYYGVAPFLVDDVDGVLDDLRYPRLVTSGLVDPAACRWGRRVTRHHRRRWLAPRVDLAGLEAGSDLGSWARRRLVPKVVVATQTRVVEAAVDAGGTWLPSTPLVSAVAPVERLWHVAAALLSPVVTVWALRHWGGVALAAGAIKLGAAQVRAAPAPAPGAEWDAAAALVRKASAAAHDQDRRALLLEAAAASCRAYGVDGSTLCRWWAARLPGALASPARPGA